MAKQADELAALLAAVKASKVKSLNSLSDETLAMMKSTSAMTMIVSIVAVAFGALLAWVIGRGIAGPVSAMTAAMRRLAGGDHAIEIPARGRMDEIGEMARAVVVFKDNMIETARLRVEQEE